MKFKLFLLTTLLTIAPVKASDGDEQQATANLYIFPGLFIYLGVLGILFKKFFIDQPTQVANQQTPAASNTPLTTNTQPTKKPHADSIASWHAQYDTKRPYDRQIRVRFKQQEQTEIIPERVAPPKDQHVPETTEERRKRLERDAFRVLGIK